MSFLLFLSRSRPASPVLEQAQKLIDSGMNWDALMAEAGRHGTSGFIYKNLQALENIPRKVLARFDNVHNQMLRHNVMLASEADRLLDALNAKGVEVITLKGPLTAEMIFGDIGLYPSGDIDMLIKVEDIDLVVGCLESEGYQLNDKGFDTYRDFYIKELYHISLSNGRYTVEPHWNLFFRYFTTPPEFWWEDSRTVIKADREYRFLSPEKDILYNSFRIFTKNFFPLRFLVMVAELIRFYEDEIDWDLMCRCARRYRFENVLGTVLLMSADLLGAKVPAEYARTRGGRSKLLYNMSVNMMFSETVPHPFHKIALVFMRDDIAGAARVILRRLFPSMGEIISRYKLSEGSPKAVIYYLLNPFFLYTRRRNRI